VENAIGLLRLFCPKSLRLSRVSHAQVAAMQNALNNRPRKCLRYKTPAALLACELRRTNIASHRVRTILQLSGETDAGSAGEQPAKG
jgi:hypothetical protein